MAKGLNSWLAVVVDVVAANVMFGKRSVPSVKRCKAGLPGSPGGFVHASRWAWSAGFSNMRVQNGIVPTGFYACVLLCFVFEERAFLVLELP